MTTTNEKLAKSLTAESVELIPYLPYLLQDLWELGSSPEDIIEMIKTHIPNPETRSILDLACGKGAVSIHLAKAFNCPVKGIDLMPQFIEEAKKKAIEHNVEALCTFETGDVKEALVRGENYDIIILGAAGDILGTPKETITALKQRVRPKGYLFIDDAYGQDGAHSDYYTKDQWLECFNSTGVTLLGEKKIELEELKAINRWQQSRILKRAEELKAKHPEKVPLFEGYVKSQQAECEELENDITAVTMLLQVT